MMVKVCGILSLEDALDAAEAGATAIGFNFYRSSPRFIEPSDAAKIARALPSNVLKAGIFVDETSEKILAIAREVELDIAQLYGSSAVSAGAGKLRFWRACPVDEDFNPAVLDEAGVEAFLLDAAAPGILGGTGKTFNWSIARGLGKRIVLAGGLDASNVRAAIELAEPWGVDACSRLESKPGRKDPGKVGGFVKAALNL